MPSSSAKVRSSIAHGVGHPVEPILHPVEHILILPALDAPQLGRRALGSERASEAGAQVAVEVEVFGVIRPAIGLGEFGACRAGVMVLLGVVDEVLPGEEARSEEHTSELQSQSNLVCRLLLEKKTQ